MEAVLTQGLAHDNLIRQITHKTLCRRGNTQDLMLWLVVEYCDRGPLEVLACRLFHQHEL